MMDKFAQATITSFVLDSIDGNNPDFGILMPDCFWATRQELFFGPSSQNWVIRFIGGETFEIKTSSVWAQLAMDTVDELDAVWTAV